MTGLVMFSRSKVIVWTDEINYAGNVIPIEINSVFLKGIKLNLLIN